MAKGTELQDMKKAQIEAVDALENAAQKIVTYIYQDETKDGQLRKR